MPDAEVLLWVRFRRWRELGIIIRRQHSIGPFIADFACVKAKLVIECDGCSHDDREEEDAARQEWLEKQGWHVMRFANIEVTESPDAAAQQVLNRILYRLGREVEAGDPTTEPQDDSLAPGKRLL
jgi:very-short-patch-repair endonuclease